MIFKTEKLEDKNYLGLYLNNQLVKVGLGDRHWFFKYEENVGKYINNVFISRYFHEMKKIYEVNFDFKINEENEISFIKGKILKLGTNTVIDCNLFKIILDDLLPEEREGFEIGNFVEISDVGLTYEGDFFDMEEEKNE